MSRLDDLIGALCNASTFGGDYEIGEARAELSAAIESLVAEAAGWQPIETAPKTSRARLVWVPANECIFCVSWNATEERWNIFGGGYRTFLSDGEPTHWMPLPEPPK